jgi:predicted MFS family arabinose efflux permease
LNAVNFLSLCNVACFFQFQGYLQELGLDPSRQGLVISVFALVGLILRPVISPWLHAGNARPLMAWSTIAVLIGLVPYNFASNLVPLLAVRVLHGLAYGVLVASITARLVAAIPEGKSGQAFGVVGIVTLLPFAVLPPLVVAAARALGGFLPVLNLTAVGMVFILPLLFLVKPPKVDGPARPRPRWDQIKANLSQPAIASLLGISLLVYIAFAPIFYFVEAYARQLGLINSGWFYTAVTAAEITVRLAGAKALDRFPKHRLLALALGANVVAYLGLAGAGGPLALLAGAVGLGLGWGVAMPLLGALLFDLSPGHLRALNANLGFFMFQAGLFFGPLVGGLLLDSQGFGAVLLLCAGLSLLGLGLVILTAKKTA